MASQQKPTYDFASFSRAILEYAHHDVLRSDFMHQVSRVMQDYSRCDAVSICLSEKGQYYSSLTSDPLLQDAGASLLGASLTTEGSQADDMSGVQAIEALCRSMLAGEIDPKGPRFTSSGSFWSGSTDRPLRLIAVHQMGKQALSFALGGGLKSIAMIPFALEGTDRGMLVMMSQRPRFFNAKKVEFYESVAQLLGVTIVLRRTQLALRERVKELSCLYTISKVVSRPDASLEAILQQTVEVLPPAWLYPEIATARIVLDDWTVVSSGFEEAPFRLRADIVIEGEQRGLVEVLYKESRPERDEGPFLREERNLIDAIAKELALIVDQRRAEEERQRLQEQLRHADRLATIGQLSAGVAHELNEPLGGILGFAQLALKTPDLPQQVHRDLGRIVSASLHAREVIGKLMLFARQTPPQKKWVDLNVLIRDGLYFIESRCEKSGIEIIKELSSDLPEFTADPGQLYQVLINLAVNAIQAMEKGGRLTIRTEKQNNCVALCVEDTGAGMSEDVQRKVFLPFFTTKDVGEGTGLGLAVAEGIVTSHGGRIEVESRSGEGTRLTVYLPLTQLERTSTP